MSLSNLFQRLYLNYLSQPAADRPLYRLLTGGGVKRILEVGLATGLRSERMLGLALEKHAASEVFYAGVDQFEGRPADAPGMNLKDAYKTFKTKGIGLRLVPGTLVPSLRRLSGQIDPVDLVILAEPITADERAIAWPMLSRLLHPGSHVFVSEGIGAAAKFRALSKAEIAEMGVGVPAGKKVA